MNLLIPIDNIRKVPGGGLSVFGSIPSTKFLKAMAAEWSQFRGSLGEAGRRGFVGPCPQLVDDGSMISCQAFVEDAETIGKLHVGALRTFRLAIDEHSGRLGEVALYDGGGEGYGLKLYKRANMSTSQVRPEFVKYMRQMGLSADGTRFLKGENQDRIDAGSGNLPEGLAPSRRASINPSLGTRTNGVGSAKPAAGDEFDSDPMEAAQGEIDIAERFAEEFTTAFAELGEQNENGDLDPAEVIRQAKRIAMRRMGMTVETDRGDLDEQTAEAADYSGTGADPIVNRMDRALFTKLSRSDRVSVGGVDALLKSDGIALRKMDDGRGGHDLAKVISEPNELSERLSASAGMRKRMTLSVADSAPRAEDFHGSHSPGILDLPPDTTIYTNPNGLGFAKRISALHARGEAGDISKLLH